MFETIVGNAVGYLLTSLAIAGLAYLGNLLVSGLNVVFISVMTAALTSALIFGVVFLFSSTPRPPTAEKLLRRGTPVRSRIPPTQGQLQNVATVTLDTEVFPFNWHKEELEKGDIVEVDAESEEGETFHFFVCDEKQYTINRRRSKNFEFTEGIEFAVRYNKRFRIPHAGTWYFIPFTPEECNFTTVALRIAKVR